jgi:hypothetical protein
MGTLYCVGSEEGHIQIYDTRHSRNSRLLGFFNGQDVNHIAWSKDGTLIAATDLSGDILIQELTARPPDEAFQSVLLRSPKLDLEGCGIDQILFTPAGESLLVISNDLAHVCSVRHENLRISVPFEGSRYRKLALHPTELNLFLSFGISDVAIYEWAGLKKIDTFSYRPEYSENHIQAPVTPQPERENDSKGPVHEKVKASTINKAIFTQDSQHFLVQIDDRYANGMTNKRLLIFNILQFEKRSLESTGQPTCDTQSQIDYCYVPQNILSHVNMVLGILPGSRLTFLDQDLWLCTFRLESDARNDSKNLERHFFVPRDWANTESLELSSLLMDGTLLCPKDDQVVALKCRW